jgi:hypothetical protein
MIFQFAAEKPCLGIHAVSSLLIEAFRMFAEELRPIDDAQGCGVGGQAGDILRY